MTRKISLIGAGNIGGTLAHLAFLKQLGEIVLFDIAEGMPQGKALDIRQSGWVEGNATKVIGTNTYSDIADSEVIIVTAGIARKPGMSRDDLLDTNTKVIKSVAENIAKYAPEAFVIVVTNPLDAMVWVMHKVLGQSSKKTVGMAGILDTSRYSYFLSQEMNVAISDIKSFVLGGHGDDMVPLLRYTSIAGVPIQEYIDMGIISQQRVNDIIDRTKNGGAEIVKLLQTGSAFYAPAASALAMAESYLYDKHKIFPCAAYLNGEYGVTDLYAGVPVVIGKNGVEKVIEFKLTEDEKSLFKKSIESVYNLTQNIKL